jgi:hypothetical protein
VDNWILKGGLIMNKTLKKWIKCARGSSYYIHVYDLFIEEEE